MANMLGSLGSVLTGGLSMLPGLFGNPADDAMGYLNKIGDTARQQYEPYQQQGQEAYGQMSPALGQMSSDPSGYINKMMGGYQQSPQFKNSLQEALRAAQNTAAAGGMVGSGQDQLGESRLADYMSQNDMQNYLNNVMGAQKTGLQGEQNVYGQGYDATKQLTDSLMNMFGSQSTLAYKGAENQNQMFGDMAKMFMSPGGGAGGASMGSGLMSGLGDIAGFLL